MKNNLAALILIFIIPVYIYADEHVAVSQDSFIQQMAKEHAFDIVSLKKLMQKARVSETILEAISRPAEKKLVWYEYKNIFLQDKRIKNGVEFWQANSNTLKKAEKEFGVPAEIIVAIIGVETFYGRITGKYRVIDALNTLAFHYPKRANFFRSEFEHFLLLTREQGFDPLSLTGSYAGAMGMPQFISSSYRNFAIDFNGDNVIDIWKNTEDAIGSVANYFVEHGWQADAPVIDKISVKGNAYKSALTAGLKPDIEASRLASLGIVSASTYDDQEKLKLLGFEQENGLEYWLARNNFYVITRYNHSELYAMAVYQLANKIKQRINSMAINIE